MAGDVEVTVRLSTSKADDILETIHTSDWDFLTAFSKAACEAARIQPLPSHLILENVTVPAARNVPAGTRAAVTAQGPAPLVVTGAHTDPTSLLDRLCAAREIGIDLRFFETNDAILSFMGAVNLNTLTLLLQHALASKHKYIPERVLSALGIYYRSMSLSATTKLWTSCEGRRLGRALETLHAALLQRLELQPGLFSLANIAYVTRQIGHSTAFTRAAAKMHADRLQRDAESLYHAINCEELQRAPLEARKQVREWLFAEQARRRRIAVQTRGLTKIGSNYNGQAA